MPTLPKIFAILSKLGIQVASYWKTIILVLVPLLIALFVYLKKRRERSRQHFKDEAGAQIAKNSLVKIYKGFLANIPSSFRAAVKKFDKFIVLGEAGSGKTSLINKYTDWESQALEFYPSYNEKKDLQIYLGSRELVNEFPSTLLNDTSIAAKKAIENLLKKFKSSQPPIFVIALNSEQLQSFGPERIIKMAQTLRGKINLASWYSSIPPEVRIVLTNLDNIEGFEEYYQFCSENRIPFSLKLSGPDEKFDLDEKVPELKNYISNVLLAKSAEDFKSSLAFFSGLKKRSPNINQFIKSLFQEEALSITPKADSIYFASQKREFRANEIFNTSGEPLLNPHREKYIRHGVLSAVLSTLLLSFISFSFIYEGALYEKALENLELMERVEEKRNLISLHNEITNFTQDDFKGKVLKYLPVFYDERRADLRKRYSDLIRDHFLLERLAKIHREKDSHQKALYLSALIYSSSDNGLGKIISGDLSHWSDALMLEKTFIENYINSADKAFKGSIDISKLPFRITAGPSSSIKPWVNFLNELNKQTKTKQFLTEAYLKDLSVSVSEFEASLSLLKKYRFMPSILNEFSKDNENPLNVALEPWNQAFMMPKKILASSEDLSLVLKQVSDIELKGISDQFVSLRLLSEELKKIHLSQKPTDKKYVYSFAEEKIEFDSLKWFELVKRTKVRFLSKDFIKRHIKDQNEILFENGDRYEDIKLNPYNDGSLLFTGKGVIPGRLSHEAFDQEIKTNLLDFDDILSKIDVARDEKSEIKNYIYREVEIYARKYIETTLEFYNSMKALADSPEAVAIILNQVKTPVSPFSDFIKTIYSQTMLDYGKDETIFFQPMIENLSIFKPLEKVLGEGQESQLPEITKYRSIISELARTLENSKAAEKDEKEKADPAKGIEQFLGPSGIFALNIIMKKPGSPLDLVDQWMKSIALDKSLGGPFRQPLEQLYLVGLREIEDRLTRIWNNDIKPSLRPQLELFPFEARADKEISADEMIRFFHPQTGIFRKIFVSYLEPFIEKKEQGWKLKDTPIRNLELPEDMISAIIAIERVTSILWDQNGKALKIGVELMPVPFELKEFDRKLLTLAYLNSGDSSLFSFNQKPSWTSFEIDWTKNQTAQLGVQFTNPKTGERSYQVISTRESFWSFFQLLSKARKNNSGDWIWEIPMGNESGNRPAVSFAIKSDPFKLFSVGL